MKKTVVILANGKTLTVKPGDGYVLYNPATGKPRHWQDRVFWIRYYRVRSFVRRPLTRAWWAIQGLYYYVIEKLEQLFRF